MASEDTRRVLKVFGLAVTNLEEALEAGRPAQEVERLRHEARQRLAEVTALVERLAGPRGR
jgi:hypothetical protein